MFVKLKSLVLTAEWSGRFGGMSTWPCAGGAGVLSGCGKRAIVANDKSGGTEYRIGIGENRQ